MSQYSAWGDNEVQATHLGGRVTAVGSLWASNSRERAQLRTGQQEAFWTDRVLTVHFLWFPSWEEGTILVFFS